MRVRVINGFFDLVERTPRHVGDEFEAGEERVKSLASAALVEAIPAKQTTRPKQAARSTRKKVIDG